MRKLFKTAILGVSALALPFALAATANASAPVSLAQTIDTRLEYQVNAAGDSMRFISTMELNGASLDNITNIELNFDLSKEGETTKHSNTVTQTTVYDRITGDNGKDQVDDTYYAVFKITDLTKNYTGWSITPCFTYNYSDGSSEDVFASPWIIGKARLYFVKTNDSYGDDIHVYMYESETHYNVGWPGAEMSYDDVAGMYYYDYALGERFNTVIFNDGTKQTSNAAVSTENNYYVQNGDEALPHPTAEHSLAHNDNQHYCEYCHYTQSHNLSGTTTDHTRTISCSECGYSVSFDLNTVYFTNTEGWSTVKVHRWGGTGESVEWPGVDARRVGVNEMNQEIYEIDVTGYESILFHNNNNWKTIDISLASLGNYNAVYLNGQYTDGAGHVGMFLYIPENNNE